MEDSVEDEDEEFHFLNSDGKSPKNNSKRAELMSVVNMYTYAG